jgi:hypothetical protein
MVHEKILLQYIVCTDKLSSYLVAWSSNNQDLWLCMWFPSLAFAWHVKSWTLPLYGFYCCWCISASIITLTRKQECLHQQDDHACLLPLSPVIIPITFWWLQYHCITRDRDFPRMSCPQVDVTASQSKEQHLLILFRQTVQAILFLLTLSASQLHVGKTLWLPVNNLHRRDWANEMFCFQTLFG